MSGLPVVSDGVDMGILREQLDDIRLWVEQLDEELAAAGVPPDYRPSVAGRAPEQTIRLYLTAAQTVLGNAIKHIDRQLAASPGGKAA